MSVPKPAVGEADANASVALRSRSSALPVARVRSSRIYGWWLTAFFFLVPITCYWPATFHDYGLRDDYSNLREAHEEPSTVERFCASHARPLYGWLLQATYGVTDSVQNLRWMRFGSALLLGALSLVMFRALCSFGWSFDASLCFSLLLALVPSAQVIAGWAVGWPYALTALLSIAGFFTVEGALTAGSAADTPRSLGLWLLGVGLLVVCALIYQPSALFYTVPLTGSLISRRNGIARTLRWLGIHTALIMGALGIAYAIMTALYASGMLVKSGRIAFEHHWVDKLAWFLSDALPNALSVFVLNDNNGRGHGWYLACALAMTFTLLSGLILIWRRGGRDRAIVWAIGLLGLPVLALTVSLLASERYATYRTVLAMTGVVLCFLVASAREISRGWSRSVRRVAAAAVVTLAFCLAQHHVYALIAVPQGNEWQLILDGAKKVRLDGADKPRVFAIASSPADRSTASLYHDEFGSLSSNSEWVPKEMFKRAMHDLHPDVAHLDSRYDFSAIYKAPDDYRPPAEEHYDVIIDLRKLRRSYIDN